MRVLLVEDDTFYAQAISEVLADRSIEVTCVHTAQDALQACASECDAAIIDVMLPNDPEVSGISNQESRGGFSTGVCVARRLLAANPNLKLMLLSSNVTDAGAESWARENLITYLPKDDGIQALKRALDRLGLTSSAQSPLAFIVHGHDEQAVLELKNYIQNTLLWREPVVLREQPSSGRTIIEKFEDLGNSIDCVFVLVTPDDRSYLGSADEVKRRSRQNVVFEMGYFYGALGRSSGRVFLLYKQETELPSDISGVVYIDISNGVAAAGETIRREIAAILR